MSSARDNYWSMLKGAAILAVLMIHMPLTNDENALLATRQLINFPVALFVFLSGYFVKQSVGIWKSVERLLVPYLIWSAIWSINTPPSSITVIITKFLTGGYSILYFLFVLIQLKLLTPCLIRRITKNEYNAQKDYLWLITPLYLAFFSFFRIFRASSFETIDNILPFDNLFPAWFVYYYLGIFCRYGTIKIRPIICVIVLIVSYYWGIVAAFWLEDNSVIFNYPYTQSKLTSMFISLSLILLVYSIHEVGVKQTVLSRIGDWSFGIYILHVPVMIGSQYLITITHNTWTIDIYSMPIVRYSCVLLITLGILFLLNRVIPQRYLRYLGLL